MNNICEAIACNTPVKIKGRRFCSIACSNLTIVRRPPLVDRSKICLYCQTTFLYKDSKEQKFCSQSCSARYNNPITKRRHPLRTECLRCATSLGENSSKYCSNYCSVAYRRETKIEKWLNGEWDGADPQGLISGIIETYVKEQAAWRCQSPTCCVPGGWSVVHQTTGKVPIHLDHIDGNALNQSPNNLRVLCPNCHSLTATYGILNKNSGRHGRMERYRAGKSY